MGSYLPRKPVVLLRRCVSYRRRSSFWGASAIGANHEGTFPDRLPRREVWSNQREKGFLRTNYSDGKPEKGIPSRVRERKIPGSIEATGLALPGQVRLCSPNATAQNDPACERSAPGQVC